MKKILITGGNGFFGSRFRIHYENEYQIISTDVDTLNILDKDAVLKRAEEAKPDYIIHAAAIALTGYCDENPEKCRDINVTGALNIGEAARNTGAGLVFLSSEQVFNGNTERGPFKEEDIPVPDTVYGQNKLEAEGLLMDMVEKLWILRFTWMFGLPGKNLPVVNNILWDTVKGIMRGERMKVSPDEYRGLTFVDDMIGNFSNVFSIPYGRYHIGSRNELSRYEIVKLIFDEMGISSRFDELIIRDNEKYGSNPRDVRLDTDKITQAGVIFDTTSDALTRCITEFSLKFGY
ncbi:MAG: NAD(P)-dependent oxidoreductase [Spirochaetales bacterium]|nr:NAD(P)-dependent oxidoreductase [Spirochaetales bacterium]